MISIFFFFIEMTFPKAGQLIFEDDYRIRLFLPLKNFGFVLFVAINGETRNSWPSSKAILRDNPFVFV